MRKQCLGVMCLVVCGGANRTAQAESIITLPGATGTEIAGGQAYNESGGAIPPTLSASYSDGVDAAVATATPFGPIVSASATGALIASASEEYYFEVVASSDITVPVNLYGLVSTGLGPSPTGSADAYAEVKIYDTSANNLVVLYLWDCLGYGCNQSNVIDVAGSFTQSLSLSANTLFKIELGAVANPNGAPGVSNANAAADPFIQIDPSFAAANPSVSVVVSPGISNVPVSTTPEPSALSLMVLSLGITWFAQRRSQRRRLLKMNL